MSNQPSREVEPQPSRGVEPPGSEGGVIGAGCYPSPLIAPLDVRQAEEVAKAFKALGDPVRVRLFSLIAAAPEEVCVCDLTANFVRSAPTISHHLKVLREAGLVRCERRGTWVYYRPDPRGLGWLSAVLAPAVDQTALVAAGPAAGR